MTDDVEKQNCHKYEKHDSMIILRRKTKQKNKDNVYCLRLSKSGKKNHSKTKMNRKVKVYLCELVPTTPASWHPSVSITITETSLSELNVKRCIFRFEGTFFVGRSL